MAHKLEDQLSEKEIDVLEWPENKSHLCLIGNTKDQKHALFCVASVTSLPDLKEITHEWSLDNLKKQAEGMLKHL